MRPKRSHSLNLPLRTFEEHGYLRSRKAIVGLRPKTTYTMTAAGKGAGGLRGIDAGRHWPRWRDNVGRAR